MKIKILFVSMVLAATTSLFGFWEKTCVLTDANRTPLARLDGSLFEYTTSSITCNLGNAPEGLQDEARGLAKHAVNKNTLKLHSAVHTVRTAVQRINTGVEEYGQKLNESRIGRAGRTIDTQAQAAMNKVQSTAAYQRAADVAAATSQKIESAAQRAVREANARIAALKAADLNNE